MAGENVVRIVVKSDNETQPGFDETAAGAEEMGAKVSAAYDEYAEAAGKAETAAGELAAAQARLDEAQAGGAGSADELAAAQDEYAAALDRSTTAALASMDAQVKLGQADLEAAGSAKVSGDAAEDAGVKSETSGGLMAGMGSKVKMAALGVAVGLGLAVKGAADFQQQTVRLVTSAGESAKNLGMVQRGILSLSASTNTSTSQLASGMYMVESAGFHGANGLLVLKAAAQGAAAEGADLGDVANAVTSGLNAYGLKASQATTFTDEMVTAVGQGKMTMQDLASSLSAVLPIAASAHISFAQVGGAIATMTSQGMSARQASQDLANSIRALLNPNAVATNEMNQFGISSLDVANKLGKRGLTGTIGYLADTIAKQMGPSGDIILKTFNQSKAAASDAETMLAALPPKVRELGKSYLDGSTSYQTWYTATKGLPLALRAQATQFAATASTAHGFNNLLKSGQPGAQTFAAALGKMMGGSTGLNTALMLTGSHTATFNANVKAIGNSAKGAGANVKGWGDIQKEANFQIGSAVKAVEAMGDSLGLALLPSVTAILKPLTSFLMVIAKNKAAAIAFAAVLGSVVAGALGAKLAGVLSDAKAGFSTLFDVIGGAPAAIGKLASGFASAASSVASFAVQTVQQLGRAMVATGAWIAEHAVAAATFIAENVAMAASATAAFIAENLATLGIIAGIALLVAGIIYLATHWKQVWGDVKKWAEDGYHAVAGFLEDLYHDAVKIAEAIYHGVTGFFRDLYNEQVKIAEDIWHRVVSFFSALYQDTVRIAAEIWHDVVSFFSSLYHDVVRFIEDLHDDEVSVWNRIWHDTVSIASRLTGDVVRYFEQLPGRVMGAIAALPGELFSFGAHAISMLASGLLSAVGDVIHAMTSIGGEILAHIPHSPAKKGPLSGSGSPDLAGRKIAQMLGQGMISGLPDVTMAANRMAGAASVGPGGARGYGPAGGGGVTLEITGGGSGLDELFITWLKQKVRVKGGGGPASVQRALGSTWPAGA